MLHDWSTCPDWKKDCILTVYASTASTTTVGSLLERIIHLFPSLSISFSRAHGSASSVYQQHLCSFSHLMRLWYALSLNWVCFYFAFVMSIWSKFKLRILLMDWLKTPIKLWIDLFVSGAEILSSLFFFFFSRGRMLILGLLSSVKFQIL